MTKKILVAEDEAAARIPMVRFLRREGYEVVDVIDPDQAVEALQEAKEEDSPFDVVILDLIMPANNANGGRDVLAFMAKEKISSHVILATAYGYDGPADRLRNDYSEYKPRVLTKTFTPDELYHAIEEVSGVETRRRPSTAKRRAYK